MPLRSGSSMGRATPNFRGKVSGISKFTKTGRLSLSMSAAKVLFVTAKVAKVANSGTSKSGLRAYTRPIGPTNGVKGSHDGGK